MATLELDLPDELYEALRRCAERNGTSMAAGVLDRLKQFVPTETELQRRREFYDRLAEFRARQRLTDLPFPSAEEMIREDRQR